MEGEQVVFIDAAGVPSWVLPTHFIDVFILTKRNLNFLKT
jgi:hypothetical protein